jgi:hypothetical protein
MSGSHKKDGSSRGNRTGGQRRGKTTRERNVRHKKAEEHSRQRKGNRG